MSGISVQDSGCMLPRSRKYAESSATEEQAKIASAKRKMLAANKEELLDKLFGLNKALNLSRKTLEAGYDAVQRNQDGSPLSHWGIVQGLTRHSNKLSHSRIKGRR